MSTVTIDWSPEGIFAKVEAAANKALLAAGEVIAADARQSISKGTRWESSAPGQPPNFQTGELAGSINVKSGGNLRVLVGTDVPHGRYMEFGATIRPKTVRAIPVPCNVQAKQMLQRIRGASLRTQNLIPIKKDGKRYLAEKTPTGKIKKNGALFVLRAFVVILARPWLRPAAERSAGAARDAFKLVMTQELAF